MKISRTQLYELIQEERRKMTSLLLEMPMASTTGSKMGAHDHPHVEDDGGDPQGAIQNLYLMARKADQLHDMLKATQEVDPKVKKEINNLSHRLTTLLDDIVYDKDNPDGH